MTESIIQTIALASALYASTHFVAGMVADGIRNFHAGTPSRNRALDLIIACLLWGLYTHMT